MKSDGTLWAWGGNSNGMLGSGVYQDAGTPQLAINEAVTGVLDLDPATANAIPADAVPKVILAASKDGVPSLLRLGARIYIGEPDLGNGAPKQALGVSTAGKRQGRALPGGSYKLYVGASVPAGTPVSPGIYILPANRVWLYYTGGALPEYLSNISYAQASHVDISILDGMDVSLFKKAEILVGFGTDDREMLKAGRYRAIYTVEGTPDRPP
jgi:hypothetical protein